MCSEETMQALLAIMERIEENTGDQYELSDPYTIGGATGVYSVPSPYHTECEWAIISALATGTFGFVAGSLGSEEAPANFNVPASAGPTTLMTGGGQLQSFVVTAAGTTNLTFQDAAGNVIATVVQPGTVGQEIQLNADFATSLVANNAATTPAGIANVLKSAVPATAGSLAMTATFAIGSKNSGPPKLSATGADLFGSGAGGADNNNALPNYVGALTQQAPFVTFGGDNFMPLPSPAFVYAQTTTPASTEVLLTVVFRRKLLRTIPDKPRQKPHTHTHVQSRRGERTFYSGFEEQYQRPGGPAYEHEIVPVTQDTASLRRGVFPLGPTGITHRGVGKDKDKHNGRR